MTKVYIKGGKTVEIGQRFGKLMVVSEAPRRGENKAYLCRCDCGAEKSVNVYSLLNGTSKGCMSCSHTKSDKWSNPAYRRIYATWMNMRARCYRDTHPHYKDYGARGIHIEWQSFDDFFADMGLRPAGKSLDRIDNDGNYSKANCRWATSTQQTRNKRTTKLVEFEGRICPLIELTDRFGARFGRVRKRLILGWSLEKALTEPALPIGFNQYSRNGESHVV